MAEERDSPAPPQRLVAPYDQRSGDMMVYGGAMVAAMMAFAAVGRGEAYLFAGALVAGAVAFYHWPLAQKGRTRLIVSRQGLTIDGLGTLKWEAIEDARLFERAVRTIRNAELQVRLNRPIQEALVDGGTPAPFPENWMYRAWRFEMPDVVAVRLEPIAANADLIIAAVEAQLRHQRELPASDNGSPS